MLLRFFGDYFAGVMFKVVSDGPLIGHLKEAIVLEKHQRKGKEREKKLIKTKYSPKIENIYWPLLSFIVSMRLTHKPAEKPVISVSIARYQVSAQISPRCKEAHLCTL